ncbi:Ubiquitin domain containing protein [Trema orientale]|uniref:Ubiquitin domain containing protein n=1 Tax=Trema orientale TaxID=63057 RepID=A0A2P5C7A2_TREOI|nr:Ubiquitin domain containing protein [Trema orientale]
MREIIEEEEEEEEKFKPLNDNKINEEKKVEIVVRTVGPARPSRLQVPSSIKVHDLRKLIAGNNHLPIENLRLILRGNVLRDSKNGDDAYLQLNNGDSLIVAVKPKPPVKNLRDGLDDDDDDEDLKFQLPQSSSRWKRRLYFFLHDKLKLPGEILATGFVIILLNLGKRQPGDISAYSIFNEDFRELPGTLNADRLDRDVRSGQF